jgi:cell division protein DivIC
MKKVISLFKNFYVLVTVSFLIWMFFVDSNDFISQFKLKRKLDKLQSEKRFYEEKIKEVEKDREELISNPKLIEKYAREKYLMRKPTEDLYVIEYD